MHSGSHRPYSAVVTSTLILTPTSESDETSKTDPDPFLRNDCPGDPDW